MNKQLNTPPNAQPNKPLIYDLIIVGSGVAGMSASIYASRYKLEHLLFGEAPGGQGILAGKVENYPGYVSIAGPELMQKFVEQVRHYGVEIKQEGVRGLATQKHREVHGNTEIFEVKTDKETYQAKTLILAMGANFRHLNIPGEEKFVGKGVSYCTHCDAPFFKDKIVAVVGGGDAAVTGALHIAEFVQKVFIIHRRDEFRAEPAWVERLRQNKKIELVLSTQVKEILATTEAQNPSTSSGRESTERVKGIVLDKPYKGETVLTVDGVFIEIGQVPSSALAGQLGVEVDEQGYIKVAPSMATNVPGIFAAGDLAAIEGGIHFRQFITAASDGARAAASVYQFLQGKAPTPSWGNVK